MTDKTILVYPCDTEVLVDNKHNGKITGILINNPLIRYEINYFNNGDSFTVLLRESQFKINKDVKQQKVGYK